MLNILAFQVAYGTTENISKTIPTVLPFSAIAGVFARDALSPKNHRQYAKMTMGRHGRTMKHLRRLR
jgi:hypothetical protein